MYAILAEDCGSASGRAISEFGDSDRAAFWASAAMLCQAVRTDDDEAWEEGLALWERSGIRHQPDNCFERAVRQAVVAVESAVDTGPSGSQVELRGPASGWACAPANFRLEPTAGPPGTEVELTWDGAFWLPEVSTLHFGGSTAAQWLPSAQEAIYLVPDGAVGTVPVVMRFENGQGEINVGSFTYQPSPTPSP